MTKLRYLMGALGPAFVVLMGTAGSAAADEWFVQGTKAISSADPSVEIKAEQGKLWKEDIKKMKLSVEGADVQITKVVLNWNNRPDQTIENVGILKAGGQWEEDAPGREGTLNAVKVDYKILNGAPTANLKVWGYD